MQHHGKQSSRGRFAPGKEEHPILRGIADGEIWGPTDVYEAALPQPEGCEAILLGEVCETMSPDSGPAEGKKNDPMMPIAWTRSYGDARIFVTTMGSADDLPSEGVRRMLVNACYWCLAMEEDIKPNMNVSIVGEFKPTRFGFGKFIKGKRPADYDLKTSD